MMADTADMASDIEGESVMIGVTLARMPLAPGVAGDCDECGHYMPRLVDGRCGFCRDGRLPPDEWVPPVRPSTLSPKEPAMPAKTINLPAFATTAINAVEERAAQQDIAIGHAAAELIEAGLAALSAPVDRAPLLTLGDVHVDALLDEVRRRFEVACSSDELAAITARAEAAEAQVAEIKASIKAIAA